ncbi:histidine phosphatase family protein [Actinoplanes sp. NPDC051861]|uniref:histidine phosphatase family protein n=1 Tax=Actinoplanes sp. NPDC051861 TaxID=3155170 RepID=UPI00341FBACE
MTGLRLIAAGHTPALRRAVFGGDDPLDEGGTQAARALNLTTRGPGPTAAARGTALSSGPGPAHGTALSSGPAVARGTWLTAPSRAARETAAALGATPAVEPALADPSYGTWTGRALADIDPADLHLWLTDPHATPHGGESLAGVTSRVSTWLARHTTHDLTAVAHPTVIRAAVAAALTLPPAAIWQLDVAPLAVIRLTHRAGRWHVHFRAP